MNRMKFFVYLYSFLLILSTCQVNKTGFPEIETTVDSLAAIGNYTDAIKILEKAKLQYLEHNYEIVKNLALLYGKIGNFDESFKLWNEGHNKGYFFGLFSHFPIYKPYKEFSQFNSICEKDMQLRKDSLVNSKTTYEIKSPKNFNPQLKYPLLIVLHGGGSSIKKEKGYWNSEILNNNFIVAFAQSYLYYDMKTFGWKINDDRARNDLRKCYDEILENFLIDTSKVIIAGISAGAYTAMDISINKFFPTTGFFAICPDVTADDFEMEIIRNAKLSGVRGVIISGENDFALSNQKQLLKKFNAVDFHHIFDIVSGTGHEYPNDFENKIDAACNFILNNI